ncbi:MAG: pilus assembly protein PilM [Phycisphaerae bacterium]|jgi:type IV pilus assembly protein PilM
MRVLGFLTKGRRLPIALDIGSDTIKMIQFRQARGELVSVAAAAAWPFPADSPQGPAQRREQAVDAVRRMWREGGFKGRSVLLALPCGPESIKTVRLPPLPAGQWRQAIKKEAQERFSFDAAKDHFSCIDAGEVHWDNRTVREVILLAAHNKVIDDHVAMLSAMKLSPVAMEASPLAAFHAFERLGRRQESGAGARVIVDIGAGGTRVVVGKGKQIILLKSLGVGGWAMTAAVARHFNLSRQEAAQFRLQNAQHESARLAAPSATAKAAVSWSAQDALGGVLESLAEEIALCLRYCAVTFRGMRPSEIILCGGEAHNPLISRFLGERLGLPVVVSRPLHGLDVSRMKHDADSPNLFAEWAICAGLAVRYLGASQAATEERYLRLSA